MSLSIAGSTVVGAASWKMAMECAATQADTGRYRAPIFFALAELETQRFPKAPERPNPSTICPVEHPYSFSDGLPKTDFDLLTSLLRAFGWAENLSAIALGLTNTLRVNSVSAAKDILERV